VVGRPGHGHENSGQDEEEQSQPRAGAPYRDDQATTGNRENSQKDCEVGTMVISEQAGGFTMDRERPLDPFHPGSGVSIGAEAYPQRSRGAEQGGASRTNQLVCQAGQEERSDENGDQNDPEDQSGTSHGCDVIFQEKRQLS